MFDAVITELDSRELAADATVAHRHELLRVGAERLALAAHWCDLHAADDDPTPSAQAAAVLPGTEQPKRCGADGTPMVSEFAADELGCLLQLHTHAAWVLMTDAVNLRHRHPELWGLVMAGQVVDWVARKTVTLVAAADLTRDQAGWVDAQTAPYAATLPVGRYLSLVQAKIIEADPGAAQARAREAALARFVRTGQSDEHGLKTLVARATAGDIIYLDAVIDRLAQILERQGDADSTDSHDVRRSKALALLATPARALQLLAAAEAHAQAEDPDPDPEPDEPLGRNDPALNAAIASRLARVDPDKLRPQATLYVHVTADALHARQGVARLEGAGPITLDQAREFLHGCQVTVQPVIDLAGGMPADCYEIPTRIHHVVKLRHPFEIFPYGTIASRHCDDDHSTRYVPPDQGGPPGQTHPDNLGPTSRRHHRVKTHHRGWRHHPITPGTYLWRVPTGHWYRVDRHGTHHLGRRISLLEQRLHALLDAA